MDMDISIKKSHFDEIFQAPLESLRSVIAEQEDLPAGKYISFASIGIPDAFSAIGALYSRGENSATVLIAESASNSHDTHELLRRLKGTSYKKLVEQLATTEIIRVAHESHSHEETTDDTDTERAAWELISEAIEMGASDIHIETRSSHAEVLLRIDGVRTLLRHYSVSSITAICNVLFTVHADASAKTKDWDTSIVMDTVITHTTESNEVVNLRFSSGPIYPAGNFQVVMRIMGETSVRTLETINYRPPQIAAAEDMIVGSQGMVILVGPTNSGKTTTMHALLGRIKNLRGEGTKITTIESPVEYPLPGATQSNVSETREGANFEACLRATFRQDPDVVMVGEIQERVAAESVKNLVLAGRKLLATLHVFEVFAVFSRLRELGVPDSVLYMPKFISGVVYQRLIPKLCTDCKVPLAIDNAEGQLRSGTYRRLAELVELSKRPVFLRGKGCKSCKKTGYKGRLPVVEMLIPDKMLLDLLRKGDETAARNYWLTSNPELEIGGLGNTAMAHAVEHLVAGLIDPNDIEIYLGPLVIEKPSHPNIVN